MSSLLEEAIIDASALKEAALKNAEDAILEKYSAEIKNAVDGLLAEAPEDELELGDPAAEEFPGEPGEVPEEELPDATLAATDGEKLCPCPEEGEEYEVNFDKLADLMDQEEMAADAGDPMATPIDRETGIMEEAGDEDLQIDEDFVAALLEELEFDHTPQKSGWSNRPDTDLDVAEEEVIASNAVEELDEETDDKQLDEAETEIETEVEVTDSTDSENLEEELGKILGVIETLKGEKETLKAQNDDIKENLNSIETTNNEYKELILKMKDRLSEINISNAKLLYTNRVLTSDSLNERQKNKIVEAISNSQTVEEARMIFDTLQSAVGTASKAEPKSLSEAVSRINSITLPRRQRTGRKSDVAVERMKILAGISK